MFHEKYLRDFLKVCENGNITAAAAQLGLSQPALSRIVKTVEKEAGMPLLVREASGVYLTQAGEIYARMAQAMVENYQNGLREIHDLRDSQSGQIRLGLSRISSETLLPVILEQFRTLYPQVELRLTETLIRQLNPLLRQGKTGPGPDLFP
ncbi:LysR family transcriptional regulator [Acidaminococcus fermentans]|uniref:LysR family transcriptional regulator n=1 Tax=Acidaminococcus fermentans TaxID=905 RepID=A0A6N7VZA3_ACIFE|nr:LysR family transcriptional regulator [Acidaminococcus fermentans]MSS81266.1 LysR family transcriptional regulator [Acidaminococcus fermentans]